jgi:hypothetical protein
MRTHERGIRLVRDNARGFAGSEHAYPAAAGSICPGSLAIASINATLRSIVNEKLTNMLHSVT